MTGEQRWKWWSILDVCERMHGSNTGASDPLEEAAETERLDWLKARIANWIPSSGAFDEAVRAVVEATIAETEGARARHARRNTQYIEGPLALNDLPVPA